MAKVGFKDAKAATQFAKKLKLKTGERLRVVLLEDAPSYAYAHVITDPSDPNKVRYYKCLGEEDMIESLGKDSLNCPACKEAQASREAPIRMAQPRYAVNAGVYQCRNDGKPVDPPVIEVIPWIFARGKVGQIQALMEEYGTLALEKDIILVCKNETFQEFDMMVVDSFWQRSKQGKEQITACQVSTAQGGPMFTDAELCNMVCTELTVDQYARMLDMAPALTDDDVAEEVARTLANLRGDGLSDESLDDGDDDDLNSPAESGQSTNFNSLVRRSRPTRR